VGLATAGPLDDLRLLVFGDHALELHQQGVFWTVTDRAVTEAADAVLGGWGPNRHHRLVVATTDPEHLPS
jgi:hypothetical protein